MFTHLLEGSEIELESDFLLSQLVFYYRVSRCLVDELRRRLREEMPQLDNQTIKLIGSGQALPDSMIIRQAMAEVNLEPGSANKLPAIELRAVIDRPKRKNEAYVALTNTRVLNRNTSECYDSALNHINPTERPRYNEPAFETRKSFEVFSKCEKSSSRMNQFQV